VTETLETVMHGPRAQAPVRSMTGIARAVTYARVYERMGRVESLLALAHDATDLAATCVWRWYACRSFARRMLLGW
jgi:hypothetical protein